MSNGSEDALLSVEDLEVYFPVTAGLIFQRRVADVKAVDGVTFNVKRGETLGLVGESGCGKSTTGKAILQLNRPTAGSVNFGGTDLTQVRGRSLRTYRRRMQMIFQDPYASLNPRMSVGSIVSEPITIHNLARGQEKRDRVHNLLQDLQDEFNLTYLFIAHDLSVVRHISDRVAVMYLGHIMELTDRDTIFDNPLHPYTKALLSAVPIPDPEVERERERIILLGDVPSPLSPPPGCVFNTRCPIAVDQCREEIPEWRNVGTGGKEHWVWCHRV